jgi:hypothetical protein
VDLLDLLGDIADQVLGRDGQRILLHERPARSRQRDHATGDVRVERRDDHRGAVLARGLQHAVGRAGAVARDDQRGAEVDREPLGVLAVADHDDVAVGDPTRGPDVHRVNPDAS